MIEPIEEDEFSALKSHAAVLAYARADMGLDSVRALLRSVDLPRESLEEAADTLAALGMRDLVKLIRSAARRAKPMPIEWLPFPQRMAARRRMVAIKKK